MTRFEKRTILEAAIARAYTAIGESSGAEMQDERFRDLLYNIDQMERIATSLSGVEEDQQKVTGAAESQNPCHGPSDTVTTKESLAVEASESEQTTDETEGEGEGEGEEPTTYTKEEVKSALAKARVKGVNAVAVLRQVGADSFQTLTSNKYAEVMRIIEQELADAS